MSSIDSISAYRVAIRNFLVMKQCFVLLILALSTLTLQGQSPIAEYGFFRDTLDETGNGRNLTLGGSTPPSTDYDDCRRYMDFTADGFMRSGAFNSNMVTTQSFTVTFWMRSADVTTDQKAVGLTESTNRGFVIGPENGVLKAEVFNGSGPMTLTSSTISADTWIHVALVFDQINTNYSIYLNGVIDQSFSGFFDNWEAPLSSDRLTLGGAPWSPGNLQYGGDLDDVKIFETALTAGQISDIYNNVGICPTTGAPIYVDINATGDSTGLTWTDAFKDLQEAIDLACRCNAQSEIWVADGTYRPSQDNPRYVGLPSRDKSFFISNAMKIYGGFMGNETMLAQAQPELFLSILDGDLGNNQDTAYNVVVMEADDISSNWIFNGFLVKNGRANGSNGINDRGAGLHVNGFATASPSISNCFFTNNNSNGNGGAIYCRGGALISPKLDRLFVKENIAGVNGGGIYIASDVSSTDLTNSVFASNHAEKGGGFYCSVGDNSSRLINNTFWQNNSVQEGGGIFLNGNFGKIAVANNILWDNTSANGADLFKSGSEIGLLQNTIHSPGSGAVVGMFSLVENISTEDPLFKNAAMDTFSLMPLSPAIDAGLNSAVPPGILLDYAGADRIQCDTVNIGAYESLAPLIVACMADIVVTIDANCTVPLIDLSEPIINCGVAMISNDAPTTFPLGETVVTWTVTDVEGRMDTCTQKVTLIEDIFPVISCPNDTTIYTDALTCIDPNVDLIPATATDNCGVTMITNDGPACLSLGQNSIKWSAFDAADNESSCTQNVTLVDTSVSTIIWIGVEDSLWTNRSNWNLNRTPIRTDTVILNDAPFDPLVTTEIDTFMHLRNNGAHLKIGDQGVMNIDNSDGIVNPFIPGISNFDSITIRAGGILNITNTTSDAFQNADYVENNGTINMSNTRFKTINNFEIFINNNIINSDGSSLVNGDIFTNNGEIYVTNSHLTNWGNGLFRNYNYINLAPVNTFNLGLSSEGTARFINQTCGYIESNGSINISSNTLVRNFGFISYNSDNFTNMGTWAPRGFQHDPNGLLPNGANTIEIDYISQELFTADNDCDGTAYCSRDLDDIDFTGKSIMYVDSSSAAANPDGSSWALAYADLQQAIDSLRKASKNQKNTPELWIAKGTYKPTKDRLGATNPVLGGDQAKTFYIDFDVKVYGGFIGTESTIDERDYEANETILSGQDLANTPSRLNNRHHVMWIYQVSDSTVLDGLVISDGYADSFGGDEFYRGAGVYNDGRGAGNRSNPNFYNCTFRNNAAKEGGAICTMAIGAGNGSIKVVNCTFENNKFNRLFGGAIALGVYSGTIIADISNSEFLNNQHDRTMVDGNTFSDGGAIGMRGGALGTSELKIANCTFEGNTARDFGGAIYIDNTLNLYCNQSVFKKNVAGRGGAINVFTKEDINYVIENSLFVKNGNSATSGGGISFGPNSDNDPNNTKVVNCTFVQNFGDEGSAIYDQIGIADVINSVIWGNQLPGVFINNNQGPLFTNSLIEGCGNSGASWDAAMCGRDGGNNIDENPLLVDTMAGDYTLSLSSPAIGAGINGILTLGDEDLDGNNRIVCNTIDMGAYEFQNPYVITCPGDVTFSAVLGSCAASDIELGTPNFFGGCGGDQLVATNDAPSIYPEGETIVTWSLRRGNSGGPILATCEQRVTLTAIAPQCPATGVPIYVDIDAIGSGDGLSWENGINNLHDGLNLACNCAGPNEVIPVWVAEGTYYPCVAQEAGKERSKTFFTNKNVQVYGGFNGTESALEERDWQNNKTIIDGDVGIPNATFDNLESLWIIEGEQGQPITDDYIFDGFTIQNAYSFTSSAFTIVSIQDNSNLGDIMNPVIRNCTFENNRGYLGGALNVAFNGKELDFKIENCKFINNQATDGAALFIESNELEEGANFEISHCIFEKNSEVAEVVRPLKEGGYAKFRGAGQTGTVSIILTNVAARPKISNSLFYDNEMSVGSAIGQLANANNGEEVHTEIVNCTFAKNISQFNEPIIKLFDFGNPANTTMTFHNSIFWNDYTDINQTFGFTPSSTGIFENCIIQDAIPDGMINAIPNATFIAGNDDAYPMFADSMNRDFRLINGSPAINTGSNLLAVNVLDLDDKARIIGENIDMGAYEFGDPCASNLSFLLPAMFDNVIGTRGVQETNQTITISSGLVNESSLEFKFGENLEMLKDFEIKQGATFRADNTGCD